MISKKPTENKHLVDIRAIKNKKSIKAVKLDAENAHKEFYGDSDDSDDERVFSDFIIRSSPKLAASKPKSTRTRTSSVTMKTSKKYPKNKLSATKSKNL